VTADDIYNNTEAVSVPELQETHMTQEAEDDPDHTYETPTRHEIEAIEEMNSANAEFTNDAELANNSTDAHAHVENNNEVAEIAEERDSVSNSASHGYNLRPRPTKPHEILNLLQTTQQSACKAVGEKPHLHVMMTQMSVKAGLKRFGKKGNEAVSKELRQLHDRKAMEPVLKSELSPEDRKRALRYLMFIKEKRDGAIKARGCANGRPQRQYTEKRDASSPTVSLEAMMLSCCIDAKEG